MQVPMHLRPDPNRQAPSPIPRQLTSALAWALAWVLLMSMSMSPALAQGPAGVVERLALGSGGWVNGSWLYEVVDKALDQAEKVAARHPDADLKVMVYAEGVDKRPDPARADSGRDASSGVMRQRIDARIRQMRQRYRNFDVLSVHPPGDAVIRQARVVRLVTDHGQDAHPDKEPRPRQPQSSAGHERDRLALAGRPLAVALESSAAATQPLRLIGAPPNPKEGTQRASHRGQAPARRDAPPQSASLLPVGRETAFAQTAQFAAAVDGDFDGSAQADHARDDGGREAATTRYPQQPAAMEVTLPAGTEPYIHRPAPLRVQSNVGLTDLRWDFGEGRGWVTGDEAEQHTWKRYGEYRVRARARDPEGQEVESAPVMVKVPVRPVAVEAAVAYEGRVIDLKTERLPVDAVVQLRAVHSGDVQRLRWYLGEEELPARQASLPVSQVGDRSLRVVAEGTPEAGTAESRREIRTSDPLRFWGGIVAIAFTWGLMAWLLLGNRWRFAEFQVKTDGEALAQPDGQAGLPQPDADLRWLGGQGARSCGRWNPLTKRAVISLAALDNRLRPDPSRESYLSLFARQGQPQPQPTQEGASARPFAWTRRDRLVFAGLDTPRPRGRLAIVRTAALAELRKADRGQLGRWLQCWIVARPGVPRRPSATGAGPSYATLAIFMRLREPGLVRRLWPEMLFAALCLVAFLAAHRLHASFF